MADVDRWAPDSLWLKALEHQSVHTMGGQADRQALASLNKTFSPFNEVPIGNMEGQGKHPGLVDLDQPHILERLTNPLNWFPYRFGET